MCGRFVDARSSADLADLLRAERLETTVARPHYNVAPTQLVRLVTDVVDTDSGELTRLMTDARWGLVPSWAKDPSVGSRMINARSETVTEKPSFRAAAVKRRAIMPASGYYEWMKTAGGKQPVYLFPADEDAPLFFAALYEWWRPPVKTDGTRQTGEAADADWLLTSTIITRAATDALGQVHDRTPVIVPPDLVDRWLDPSLRDKAGVEALLADIPDPHLQVRNVGTAVGNVRNHGPELIEPAAP